jgi:hypothetical protein
LTRARTAGDPLQHPLELKLITRLGCGAAKPNPVAPSPNPVAKSRSILGFGPDRRPSQPGCLALSSYRIGLSGKPGSSPGLRPGRKRFLCQLDWSCMYWGPGVGLAPGPQALTMPAAAPDSLYIFSTTPHWAIAGLLGSGEELILRPTLAVRHVLSQIRF